MSNIGTWLWETGRYAAPRQVGDLLRRDGLRLRVMNVIQIGSVSHVVVEHAAQPSAKTERAHARRQDAAPNDATLPAVRVPKSLLDALQEQARYGFQPLSEVVRRALLAATR